MTDSRPTERDLTAADRRTGVVIVDHGSRLSEANAVIEQFARLFEQQAGYEIVEPAHMELAEPSIATAFSRCIERGATRVIVAPYFFGPGKHAQQDIPALAREAAARHPNVTCLIADPIGVHPLMVPVIASRVDECLTGRQDQPGQT